MPRAFLSCLDNVSPLLTVSPSRIILICQEMTIFICNRTEKQHRFLVAAGTLSHSASGQSSVLRPREVCDLSLTCFKVFTSKASKNLAESLEIDTLKGRRNEAIFNKFPCLTTSHQRPKVSISIGTQSSRSEKKFFTYAGRCLLQQLSLRNLFGLMQSVFQFSKCTKWVSRESVVVMKLLHYGSEKWDVWTSNWEHVCSGVLDLWVSEWRGVLQRGHSEQFLSKFSTTWEEQWKFRTSAMGRLTKIRSILGRVRMSTRAVASLLV